MDALLFIAATGCQWRALPKNFPPRSTVQGYFYRRGDDGTWHWINDALVKRMRLTVGRKPTASAGIIDSQSVKTTESGGPAGFDAAIRIKGRKRHIVTDTEGWLLALPVQKRDFRHRSAGRSGRSATSYLQGRPGRAVVAKMFF